MPLDVVILGPPGAGKGTQAKRIASDTGIAAIATGDILRAAMAAGTGLGRRIKPIYDRGDLVPDELMVALIRERLSEDDTESGFLLDGFPRTLAQAEALDGMLSELGRGLTLVFELQLPDSVAKERLLERARKEGRTDDTPEVVEHRHRVFHQETEPVVMYYRAKGILVGIHADRAIDEVWAEIEEGLDQTAKRPPTTQVAR